MYKEQVNRLCMDNIPLYLDQSINSILDESNKISYENIEDMFDKGVSKALNLFVKEYSNVKDFKFTIILSKSPSNVYYNIYYYYL